MRKQLAELQSTFLQTVDHELRTPVTIIHGYAELLSEGTLGELAPEQEQAIVAISTRAYELRTLVERITTLVAVKAGAAISISFNLADVVKNVIEARRPGAVETGLTLETDLESNLPLIKGHPHHLQQAIDALVENAIKFTPQGGRVEVHLGAKPGWTCLTVSDTGIGIPEDKLPQIFGSFYQVDGSLTRKYGGLGLGLTVARTVVEAYSGQIEVESQVDQGTRFTVNMPTLETEIQVEQMSTKKDVKRQRILIVDDEASVVLTLRKGLKKLPNYEVLTATSAKEALQLFEEQPFDLLITDFMMPDIDGLTLASQIRERYSQTIILMITAYSNEELERRASTASVQRILNKPIRLNEFRQVAAQILQETGQNQDF
jgi:CheY-like chemotaxis protein/two-component sensor histidine kinase